MSSGHHDDHHSTEQKPVAFTVPFILAAVTILAVVMFLSLCDPKPHHAGDHEMENPAHAKFEGHEANPHSAEGSEPANGGAAATSTAKDSTHTDQAAPEAHHDAAEHH